MSIAGIHGLDAEVMEINVKADAKVTQVPIQELDFPKNAIIGGIIRDGNAWIADGNFQINAKDKVVVFALPEGIQKVLEYFS